MCQHHARWSVGDVVVLRYLGRIRAGMPAIMVDDGRKRVLVYPPHGTLWFGAPETGGGPYRAGPRDGPRGDGGDGTSGPVA